MKKKEVRIDYDKTIEVCVIPEAEVILVKSARAKLHDTLTHEEADRLAQYLKAAARQIREAIVIHQGE